LDHFFSDLRGPAPLFRQIGGHHPQNRGFPKNPKKVDPDPDQGGGPKIVTFRDHPPLLVKNRGFPQNTPPDPQNTKKLFRTEKNRFSDHPGGPPGSPIFGPPEPRFWGTPTPDPGDPPDPKKRPPGPRKMTPMGGPPGPPRNPTFWVRNPVFGGSWGRIGQNPKNRVFLLQKGVPTSQLSPLSSALK